MTASNQDRKVAVSEQALRNEGWRTQREVHEAAAGYSLPDSFFRWERIDPCEWVPPSRLLALDGVLEEVFQERLRQSVMLGYTGDHDDTVNQKGELLRASLSYLAWANGQELTAQAQWPRNWQRRHMVNELGPMLANRYQRRQALIQGIALAVAEVERLDRLHNCTAPTCEQQSDGNCYWMYCPMKLRLYAEEKKAGGPCDCQEQP